MIRGTWTIFRRELAGLFFAPLAWALLGIALLVNGFYFAVFLEGTRGDVGVTMMLSQGGAAVFWALLVTLAPLVTMRMISEEARSGTLEFLLTAPVSDASVVLGKLGAATALFAVLWCSNLVYAATLAWLGRAPDWGPVASGFAGAVLCSAFFSGVGLVASAGTGTPLLAAFLALVGNVAVLSLPLVPSFLKLPSDHALARAVAAGDVIGRFQSSFLIGVLDTRHIVFLLAWTTFLVFLATRLLEARRWRA